MTYYLDTIHIDLPLYIGAITTLPNLDN